MNSDDLASWGTLASDLWRRTVSPISHPSYLFYLFLGVLVCGGLGVWGELLKLTIEQTTDPKGLFTAISTFYPALIGAASLQLILEGGRRSYTPLIVTAVSALSLMVIGAILIGTFREAGKFPEFNIAATGFLCILGLLLVTIANANNPDFQKSDPSAASGGDPDRQLEGSTEGFKQ